MAKEPEWKVVEVKRAESIPGEPGISYRLPSGFSNMEIQVDESPFDLEVRHVAKEDRMKIAKKTTIAYTLDEKELSRIVLKSMELREELVDDIVFILDSAGIGAEGRKLEMRLTMLYNDDTTGKDG